ERGLWHLANAGAVTWAELAEAAADAADISADNLVPKPTASLGLAAERPLCSALTTERGLPLPPLHDALARYAAARAASPVG
ncbi:MAG: sugar nucleotide-binding protein, partial [Actinomycetota bacterium]|nr:sugar nucleotide-binding protein [Actinomycetota bacterium]